MSDHEPTTDDVSDLAERPTLHPDALRGPLGEYVAALEGHTESAPGPLLTAMLAGFGCMVGRGPHLLIDGARHGPNIFAVIVGATGGGRKSTALHHARRGLERADPTFWPARVLSGFGSGEAVVKELAPPAEGGAPPDPRLLIEEHELGALLISKKRDGSIMSPIIRAAWDGTALANRTKGAKLVALTHHVGVLGAITTTELRSLMTGPDAANGFANRFLFILGYRVALLPDPPPVPESLIASTARILADAMDRARGLGVVPLTPAARGWWHDFYLRSAQEPQADELFGQLTTRHGPTLKRLALCYALAARADAVHLDHLESAHAVIRYAADTLRHVFPPTRTLSPDALKLVQSITAAGAAGLARGDWPRVVFGSGNVPARRLNAAAKELHDLGLASLKRIATAGRPREVWYLPHFVPKDGENGGNGEIALDGGAASDPLSPITPISTIPTHESEGNLDDSLTFPLRRGDAA